MTRPPRELAALLKRVSATLLHEAIVSVHGPDCLIQSAVQYFNMFACLHDVEGGLTLADRGT